MASKDFSETKKNCQPLGDVAVLEKNAPEKAKDVAKYGVITVRTHFPQVGLCISAPR